MCRDYDEGRSITGPYLFSTNGICYRVGQGNGENPTMRAGSDRRYAIIKTSNSHATQHRYLGSACLTRRW